MVRVFKSEMGKALVQDSYNQILEMWSVNFQEHDIKGMFGTTHCITAGSKENPPLLLFHGVGDNSAIMWVLNIKELSKYFYCITVDTIGGPGRSIPNENYKKNTFNQVEWINHIVDFFKIDNFNIAGVSNGAYMAYNYAVANSEKVHKVICMEGGMITKPYKTMIQTMLLMFPEIIMPTHQNLMRIIKKLSSPNSTIFEKYPLLAEHLVLLMKHHNQQAMFAHKIEKYDKEKGVAIRDKLYFLIGEYRIDQKKDFIEVLEKGGFQYKVILNAGHGINHEQSEVVNREVVHFLTK